MARGHQPSRDDAVPHDLSLPVDVGHEGLQRADALLEAHLQPGPVRVRDHAGDGVARPRPTARILARHPEGGAERPEGVRHSLSRGIQLGPAPLIQPGGDLGGELDGAVPGGGRGEKIDHGGHGPPSDLSFPVPPDTPRRPKAGEELFRANFRAVTIS
jgi:hypothetical protein